MRRTILLLTVAMVLAACGGSTQDGGRTPAAAREPALGHYEGPWVSFDYPDGWHEFDWQYWAGRAAYGPVSGGNDDFVGIALAPWPLRMEPEDVLASAFSKNVPVGSVESVDVNGLPGYTVLATPTVGGQVLEAQATLIDADPAFVVICQYGEHAKEQVVAGCEMVKDTFVETPPPPITDPSGCTDAGLALLARVPMPEGALPGDPEALPLTPKERSNEVLPACDLMVYRADLAYDHVEDLIAFFRSRLTDAGWHPGEAQIVRTWESMDVWQMSATRDFDVCMVEAYAEGDRPDHFFITVWDH